jgi:hypothetical protein
MGELLIVIVPGCALLVILGALIGTSLNDQLREQRIREQARLQRRIGERWRDIVQHERAVCPHCGRSRGGAVD